MIVAEKIKLCIGCWYSECDLVHTDPDYDCACCMGYYEKEKNAQLR